MFRFRKFYGAGIRFECQGCGRCCLARGDHGYVYLTPGDRKRLADALGLPPREFMKRYADVTDGMLHLRDPERDCIFLVEGRCNVYTTRPFQCRTWPFWPENMKKKVWERDIAAHCPGIGRGRWYSAEEIDHILAEKYDIMA